jgi:hypothetical protein
MEEEGLHGPRYAASVAQQSDHRRILCSSEQSKLCPCRTKSLLSDKNQLALPGAGESAPKSRIPEEKKVQTKNLMCMERTTGTRTGRKPKSDPADRKYSFRLNAEENTRFEKLLADSGAGDRTLFIKKSIFSGQIKVVRIDKATMDYYIKLTEFHKQFQAVGNNYNQVVRALKNNFGEKRAMALLYKLEKLSIELMLVCKKVMALTQEYERKWLQK